MERDRKNLLIRLSSYKPTVGRTPLEDFITEAFAYILIEDKDFLRKYLSRLLGQKSMPEYKDVSIETQMKIGDSGRIDLAIEWNNGNKKYKLFVEHKVWSSPGVGEVDGKPKTQIDWYCDHAEKEDNSYVTLVTVYLLSDYSKHAMEHRNCYLGTFTWRDIAELLKDHIAEASDDHKKAAHFEIEKYFIELLKHKQIIIDDFTMDDLSPEGLKEDGINKANILTSRMDDFFGQEKPIKLPLLSKSLAWGYSSHGIGKYGLLFHNSPNSGAKEACDSATIWFFVGLYSSNNENWCPASLSETPGIPDVGCFLIFWFEDKQKLDSFQGDDNVRSLANGFEQKMSSLTDIRGKSFNYYALMIRNKLTDYLQEPNNGSIILQYLADDATPKFIGDERASKLIEIYQSMQGNYLESD